MSSIQKILNISSESLSSDLNMYRELDDFLLKKNGFYTFESAFHFFSSKEIKSVNNFLLKETIYKTKGKLYFSEDLFGNLFYLEDNNILFLNLETNKSEFIAHSLSQWAIELLKDYNYLSGYSLAHDWQVTHRKIFVNERLKPKKNFIFGGEYNISNLMTIDRFENLKFNSELIQIRQRPERQANPRKGKEKIRERNTSKEAESKTKDENKKRFNGAPIGSTLDGRAKYKRERPKRDT